MKYKEPVRRVRSREAPELLVTFEVHRFDIPFRPDVKDSCHPYSAGEKN